MKNEILIGTRESKLALWQAQHVSRLLSFVSSLTMVIVPIKSYGDKEAELTFDKMTDKGFFTRELDQALILGDIDIAIHSLKDIPTEFSEELEISAILKKEDPSDVLISKHKRSLKELPPNGILATGSLRRMSQVLAFRKDLQVVPVRGNLPTRYQKLKENEWEGIILAAAGVIRLGMEETISEHIPMQVMLPAAGQGSLAIMSRKDSSFLDVLKKLEDRNSVLGSHAERAFLKELQAGCSSPIACYAKINDKNMTIEAFIGDRFGKQIFRNRLNRDVQGNAQEAERLGIELAHKMLEEGAGEILSPYKLEKQRIR